jgi:antirestriction protein ArdC
MHTRNNDAVKAKIAQAQEQLEAQLAALQTSDDWRRTLERLAILGPVSINRFSFRNILLLLSQRQQVRHAATFNAWHQRGRHVRKGEKGLTVLRPRVVKERDTDAHGADVERHKLVGFSHLTVFALEQTDGEPLPEPIRPQHIDTPEGFSWTVDTLRTLVSTLPGVAGITLRARGPEDSERAAGWYDLRTHHIVVVTGEAPEAQTLKTLLHEVAHAVLHGDGEHHATPTAEVEAESTAFVVAHALGLDTAAYSLPYVATWALAGDEKEPTKAVAQVGERVRRAAGIILAALFPNSDAPPEAESLQSAA